MRSPHADGSELDFVLQRRNGDAKLLSAEEEFALVEQLCKVRQAIDKLIRPQVKNPPESMRLNHFDQLLSYYSSELSRTMRAATVRKVERLLSQYNRIKHRLVVANLAWVTKLSRSQRHTTVAEEDLFQEGVCGLLKAIDRFEAARGLRLMTYATWYIREAMQQVRARQSHFLSLSAHDQTLLGQLEALRTEFQHEHERLPSPQELGKRAQRNPRSVSRLQNATAPVVSLDRAGVDGPMPIATSDPTMEFDRAEELHSAVARLMASLPQRERFIVARRFGLDGQEPTSLEKLGDDLKVSKERVRQLQRQALRRMQERAVEEDLELVPA